MAARGAEWLSPTHARIFVVVDLHRETLCGRAELELGLGHGPVPASINLNASRAISVQHAVLTLPSGNTVTLEVERLPVQELVDEVVPARWGSTRDACSFESCHGATLQVANAGELSLALPEHIREELDAVAGGDRSSGAHGGSSLLLSVDYSVHEPEGGIHFARRTRGCGASYAYSIPLAGAARRWMPCVDTFSSRCTYELHLSLANPPLGAAALPPAVAFGSGVRCAPRAGWPGSLHDGSPGATAQWSWTHGRATRARDVGFLVGYAASLQSCDHPTLPGVTLALGARLSRAGQPASVPSSTHQRAPTTCTGHPQCAPASPAPADGSNGRLTRTAAGCPSTAMLGPPAVPSAHQAPPQQAASPHKALWPQLLYLARSLPTMLEQLGDFFLSPPVAEAGGTVGEEPATQRPAGKAPEACMAVVANGAPPPLPPARDAAAGLSPDAAPAWASGELAHGAGTISPVNGAAAGSGGLGGGARSSAAASPLSLLACRPPEEPCGSLVVAAIEGCAVECAALGGLLLLDASILHPPAAVDPGISLRVCVARALCRSWVRCGSRLSSEEDAWLAMGVEGRFVHRYIRAAFGSNEAVHELAAERRLLARISRLTEGGRPGDGPIALVPSVAELERWGGGLHEEQRWCEHRMLKAAWVLRMIEARMKERDNGRAAVAQLYSRLVPLRPVPRERVLRSTSELFKAIRSEYGLDLDSVEEQWVREARPCPAVQAGFAYSKKRFVAEVVVVQAREAGGHSARAGPLLDSLTVGWGEVDAADGAVSRKRKFKLRERAQALEIEIESRRRRGPRRRRARASAPLFDDEEEEEGAAAAGSDVPLLWLRLDPELELAVDVEWPARGDARWTGTPEFMAREQVCQGAAPHCARAGGTASLERWASAVFIPAGGAAASASGASARAPALASPLFPPLSQLELARDVAAQCEAARSLACFDGSSTAISALAERLGDETCFHRVREAAADALRQLVSPANNYAALDALIGCALAPVPHATPSQLPPFPSNPNGTPFAAAAVSADSDCPCLRLVRYIRRFHCDGAGVLLPYRFAGGSASEETEAVVRELGHYLTLRAVVDAIGTCRDAHGRTPPAAIAMLHELLDDSTNAANPCDDGYLHGAVVELLGGATPGAARNGARQDRAAGATGGAAGSAPMSAADSSTGAVAVHLTSTAAQVCRLLMRDALRPTHGRVLTTCCLRAMVQLELKWGLLPSWHMYLQHEADEGAHPAVRLEAARCLLALALELPAEGAVAGGAMGAKGGGAGQGRLADAPQPCAPVLALALRLDEARWHAPLERLQLWLAFVELLEAAEVAEAEDVARAAAADDAADESGGGAAASGPLARQRALLGSGAEGGRDGPGAACCQLLWQLLTSGHAAPRGTRHVPADVRLRLVLCRVWRIFFGERTPECLGITEPVRISHREILARYLPPYRERQKAERAARLARQAEEKAAAKSALRLRFASTVTGVTTHARHGISERVEHILYQTLEWRLCGAIPPFVEAIREKVDQYAVRSESKLCYEFSELPEAQPLAPEVGSEGGDNTAPPAAPSVPGKSLMIKLTL